MPILNAFTAAGPVDVYLGFGANTGNPENTITEAFEIISKNLLSSARLSQLYITAPQDVINQPDFINAACCGIYSGKIFQLLESLHRIEKDLGRNRSIELRRGPRSIDIDILLFGDFIIESGKESDGEGQWIKIPHERLFQRIFALEPVLELNPDLSDPVSGKPLKEFAARLENQKIRLMK